MLISFDAGQVALLLALGAIFGALGGLFGIGGGLIAIPILTLFFHLTQQQAQGTALVMVAPNVVVGLINYWRRGGIDWHVALLLAIPAFPFTYIGAQYATHAGPILRGEFGAFMAILAVYFAYRGFERPRARDTGIVPRYPIGWVAPIGAAGGALSGVFSVGGAIFAVPILSLVFGYSQVIAQGLSLALVAPGTLVSLAKYASEGDIVWPIGLLLAVSGIPSVGYGVKLAHALPERWLRLSFSVLLAFTAAALFHHS